MKPIVCETAEQTAALGEALGRCIDQGLTLALKGDLGAGKTTFVQGLARGLGVPPDYYVTSPTFSIVNEYPAGGLTLYHLDLYRLSTADELDYIGLDDIPADTAVVAVEWPGIMEETAFDFDLEIHFHLDDRSHRILSFFPSGQPAANLLSKMFSLF